jgi:hypothetical protein
VSISPAVSKGGSFSSCCSCRQRSMSCRRFSGLYSMSEQVRDGLSGGMSESGALGMGSLQGICISMSIGSRVSRRSSDSMSLSMSEGLAGGSCSCLCLGMGYSLCSILGESLEAVESAGGSVF